MSTIILNELSKESYNFLKWLNNNTSKDKNRPVLTGIKIESDGTIFKSTSGFNLVVAELNERLHPGIIDGLYQVTTLNRKVAILESIDGNYPDFNQILVSYETKLQDAESFLTLDPDILNPVITGFDQVDINITAKDRPVQVVMHSDSMPSGKYIGVVMPYRSDNNFKSIQDTFKDIKTTLTELELT